MPTQQSSSRPGSAHASPQRTTLSPVLESTEERRQSEPSRVSFLSTLSRKLSDDNGGGASIRSPPAKQSSMRDEINRLKEEMELRRQEELDQLSSLLETLMDRFDAIVEENRALRQENEWLKSHVPAS